MSDTIVPYEFIMKSNPAVLDTSDTSFRAFERIYFSSSIYSFFPYLEVAFTDHIGIVIDQLFFIEGLEFNVKFGNFEMGYLEHNYCWSENQVLNCKIANHISGTNMFLLLSNYQSLDAPKSRAWTQLLLSNVIEIILATDWKLIKNPIPFLNKVNVTLTDLPYDWCQVNETNSQFIQKMAEASTNIVSPFSPFVSFINSAGEFYFTTINDLFLTQRSVATYILEMTEDTTYQPWYLKAVEIYFGGMPVNKADYKKQVFYITGTGDFLYQYEYIQLHSTKRVIDRIPIRRNYVQTNDILDMGITETPADLRIMQAKVNNKFVDSALSIRMAVIVSFHPNLVTGHLITLEINSALAAKQIGIELSGDWLIIEDEIIYDFTGSAMSKLTIARGGVTIDIQNPFLKDFII